MQKRIKRNISSVFNYLLFIGAVSLMWIVSCKEKTKKDEGLKPEAGAAIAPQYFYKLKLDSSYYEVLKKQFRDHGGIKKTDKLVFQFYYPDTLTTGSPTLGAYPLRTKNQAPDPTSLYNYQLLQYVSVDTLPIKVSGRSQFLGDQQVIVDSLEKIIVRSNPTGTHSYQYLLFTPKFNPTNPHIYYSISVYPTTATPAVPLTQDTDPSPPAEAQ